MLRLPAFRYLAPATLADALKWKAEAGPAGMYVAGGTNLYPNMKRRQQVPATVISLAATPALLSLSQTRIGAITLLTFTGTQTHVLTVCVPPTALYSPPR